MEIKRFTLTPDDPFEGGFHSKITASQEVIVGDIVRIRRGEPTDDKEIMEMIFTENRPGREVTEEVHKLIKGQAYRVGVVEPPVFICCSRIGRHNNLQIQAKGIVITRRRIMNSPENTS